LDKSLKKTLKQMRAGHLGSECRRAGLPASLSSACRRQLRTMRETMKLIMFAALAAMFVFAALSPEPKARPKAPWQVCQWNLNQIRLAKEIWAVDADAKRSPGWDDLRPYLLKSGFTNGQPICPESGTYSIGALNEAPHCSLGKRHVLP